MNYTAFVADLINSKKLKERENVQVFIKDCLKTLNNIFKESLEFDVIFSAGDEVQGLFKSPASAYLYWRLLKGILFPIQMRCGIGVGQWDVRIPNGTSNEQDGSAYHKARIAITNAHEMKDTNVVFYSTGENDVFINTLISTSLFLEKKQTHHQKQIMLLIELLFPLFDKNAMNLLTYNQLYKVIQNKFSTLPDVFEPFLIFLPIENKCTLPSTLKKGLSTKISKITQTTRQNIDNVIQSGNIEEIRKLDLTILILIQRTFEEVDL